ncbi:GNAT family N-acetyltransferase [candidate division TA06 bacterium B3_TA06]|uniref:GNAT family N-acetyltransferase n=1 Tax=candidate division TA06 bacterium B3_TA06 TaxID=2012487 RepID=A0A532V111_UNCT6|nr:MAG: GNAT family N-acetyltransferase [candidate division TA06 bacterium B3_TA06]
MRIERLTRKDVGKIEEIDRSEIVRRGYKYEGGKLKSMSVHWDAPGWSPEHFKKVMDKTAFEVDRGGVFLGALDGDRLAGFAVLGHKFRGDNLDMLQLVYLHVSRAYRKQGIATRLMAEAEQLAKKRGARYLYVSSVPSESAVGFYLHEGCRLAEKVDPELYALEPEDIHLIKER